MPDKVSLENTVYVPFYSEITSYTYDLNISIPDEAPTAEGFPVIFLLDGNAHFTFGRDVVRLQSRNAPKTFVKPAIVVGIGHQGGWGAVSKRRFYDYTPPSETYIYPERMKDKKPAVMDHGGAADFLLFMEKELMPFIEGKYSINQAKRTLFGHSLGGLVVLYALFTRAELFHSYLACSPSIWWNEHELFHYAEEFNRGSQMKTEKRLFIAAGSEEGFMADDARDLEARLKTSCSSLLESDVYIAPNENHASVVPAIMSRAFRFANIG